MQQQFSTQDLGLLQNLFSHLGHYGNAGSAPNEKGNYDPDYIEYDDEVPEGQQTETVILSNDDVP